MLRAHVLVLEAMEAALKPILQPKLWFSTVGRKQTMRVAKWKACVRKLERRSLSRPRGLISWMNAPSPVPWSWVRLSEESSSEDKENGNGSDTRIKLLIKDKGSDQLLIISGGHLCHMHMYCRHLKLHLYPSWPWPAHCIRIFSTHHDGWLTISARRPFLSPFFGRLYSTPLPRSYWLVIRSLVIAGRLSNCLRHLQVMSLSSSVTLTSRSATTSASSFVSSSTVAAAASSTTSDDLFSSRTSYFSTILTSLIACIASMLGFMYLAVLSWAWRYSMSNPRALNKTSGVLIQRHAPGT